MEFLGATVLVLALIALGTAAVALVRAGNRLGRRVDDRVAPRLDDMRRSRVERRPVRRRSQVEAKRTLWGLLTAVFFSLTVAAFYSFVAEERLISLGTGAIGIFLTLNYGRRYLRD